MSGGAAMGGDFLRAVVRRFDRRTLVRGAVVVLGLAFLGGLGLVTPVWGAPGEVQLSRFVEAVVTGVCVFVAVTAADELVERGGARLPVYGLAVVTSAVAGAWLSWEVRAWTGLRYPSPVAAIPHDELLHRLDVATIAALVGGLATFVHANRRAAIAARRRRHAAERARADARRRTLESELQALQARVEPAFLFDTLRRIRAFYRSDAPAAGAMLEDLIVYLRAALPHLRESTSTVATEATLAGAWLEIVRRSRPDWRVRMAVAADAADAALPALVLLPLVQHAAAEAGDGPLEVAVEAARDGGSLRLAVRWTLGPGPVAAEGRDGRCDAGLPDALAAVAARLQALYGGSASLARTGVDGVQESVVRVPVGHPAEAKP